MPAIELGKAFSSLLSTRSVSKTVRFPTSSGNDFILLLLQIRASLEA
jgi:hypothetical protein